MFSAMTVPSLPRCPLAALSGAVLGALLGLPLLHYCYGFDQGVYGTIAEVMRRGGLPYRDAWEMRPPGVFYAYGAAFALLGQSPLSLRIFDLLSLALSSSALAVISTRRFGSVTAGMIAALALPLLYVPFGYWHTAQSESFQMPFILWGLALWPVPDGTTRTALYCFAAGVLLGISGLFKTSSIFIPLAVLLDRVRIDWKAPTVAGRLRLAGLTAVALAMPTLLVFTYYAARGVLPEMTRALFVFAPEYARASWQDPILPALDRARELLFDLLSLPALLLAGCGLARALACRRAEALRWAVFSIGAALSIVLQMKFLQYHYVAFLPFIALWMGLAAIEPRAPSRGGLLNVVSLLLAAALAGAFLHRSRVRLGPEWRELARPAAERRPECDRAFPPGRECPSHDAARAIRARTGPEDAIFIWGNDPKLYLLADRPQAGAYSYIIPVTVPWAGRETVHDLVERLRHERPRLIITVRNDAVEAIVRRPEDSEGLLDVFPEMRDFIQTRYREVENLGRHRLWARSGS